MINLSFPRTGTGSDSPCVSQAPVEVPGGRIQPFCCQTELCPSVEEEDLFCPGGWKVFREEVPFKHLKDGLRASLVARWLRIRLPVQGTRVRALVREDPTCRGATKPMRHNY